MVIIKKTYKTAPRFLQHTPFSSRRMHWKRRKEQRKEKKKKYRIQMNDFEMYMINSYDINWLCSPYTSDISLYSIISYYTIIPWIDFIRLPKLIFNSLRRSLQIILLLCIKISDTYKVFVLANFIPTCTF